MLTLSGISVVGHADETDFETIPEEQTDFDGNSAAQHVNGSTDEVPPAEQLSPGLDEEEITVEQVRQSPNPPSNSIWPYLSSDLVRSEREYC